MIDGGQRQVSKPGVPKVFRRRVEGVPDCCSGVNSHRHTFDTLILQTERAERRTSCAGHRKAGSSCGSTQPAGRSQKVSPPAGVAGELAEILGGDIGTLIALDAVATPRGRSWSRTSQNVS